MAKVIVCTCVQCRAAKRKKHRNIKNKIKRLLNKRRRKGGEGNIYNWYWA